MHIIACIYIGMCLYVYMYVSFSIEVGTIKTFHVFILFQYINSFYAAKRKGNMKFKQGIMCSCKKVGSIFHVAIFYYLSITGQSVAKGSNA